MPKVKAYVGNNCIIPVESARIDTVYQCKRTNQLYQSKDEFVAHLVKIRKKIHLEILESNLDKIKETVWQIPSFDSVFEWINSNSLFMHQLYIRNNPFSNLQNHNTSTDFYFKITKVVLNWTIQASNSHCAPRGMRENWDRFDTLPKGYPGWVGRIFYETNMDQCNRALKDLGIHIGTGGGTAGKDNIRKGSYSVTLFADDWKAASHDTQAEQTMLLLTDPDAQLRKIYTYK